MKWFVYNLFVIESSILCFQFSVLTVPTLDFSLGTSAVVCRGGTGLLSHSQSPSPPWTPSMYLPRPHPSDPPLPHPRGTSPERGWVRSGAAPPADWPPTAAPTGSLPTPRYGHGHPHHHHHPLLHHYWRWGSLYRPSRRLSKRQVCLLLFCTKLIYFKLKPCKENWNRFSLNWPFQPSPLHLYELWLFTLWPGCACAILVLFRPSDSQCKQNKFTSNLMLCDKITPQKPIFDFNVKIK